MQMNTASIKERNCVRPTRRSSDMLLASCLRVQCAFWKTHVGAEDLITWVLSSDMIFVP